MAHNDHSSRHHAPPPGPGHTPGPADAFFERIRSTGLVRPERKAVAGVCLALAQRFGVDVNVVRIIWVIATLTLAGGPGLLAYLLGWLFIPAADGRIVAQEILRGQAKHAIFIVILVLVIGMPIVGHDGDDGPPVGLFIGLVVTGFCAWLWWNRKNCRGHNGSIGGQGEGQVGQQSASGPDLVKRDNAQVQPGPIYGTYGPPTYAPAWSEASPDGQASQPAGADGQLASGEPRIDDDEDWEDGQPPPYVNPMSGPADTGDWRASYQSPQPDPAPAPPVAAIAARPVTPGKTPRRRPAGARVVIATAGTALVASAVTLLLTRPDTVAIAAFTVGLVSLIVIGLFTVLMGLIGRRSGGLVALAIPALIISTPHQLVTIENESEGTVGAEYSVAFNEATWTPKRTEIAGATYKAVFGSANLSLENAADLPKSKDPTVAVRAVFGEVIVTVPKNVTVSVKPSEGFGEVEVLDSDGKPVSGAGDITLGKGDPQLTVDAQARFGSVQIMQEK